MLSAIRFDATPHSFCSQPRRKNVSIVVFLDSHLPNFQHFDCFILCQSRITS